ncbi:MAG: HAD-IIA family hydrolase [Negativicutes bacterium]
MAQIKALRCFALDMDGTVYLGDNLLPGALEFLQYLRDTGREYIFLTNNSSKDSQAYVEKLTRIGVAAVAADVLTSGEATAIYLKKRKSGARIFLLGTENLEREFTKAGFVLTADKPDFVVLGFDMTLSYAKLVEACHLIREGVEYIATHPDINCPVADRTGYIPDVGAMIELIKASTGGVVPKIIGKPNREIIEALQLKKSKPQSEMAMVGDRIYTDVAMAKNAGITGILVLSGETTIEIADSSSIKPDVIVDNLGGLLDLLKEADSR